MPGTFYVNYFDDITPSKTKALMAACAQIVSQKKPDAIYFLFSSGGGNVASGITLYNYLKAIPCKVIMHNTGTVDSVGTVIFLSGDERYACSGTSFLFHGVATGFQSNQTIGRPRMQELLSTLTEDENKIAQIVASECSLSVTEMQELFRQGAAKNLDFALAKSIIQEVRQVLIPPEAEFISLDFR